MDCPKRAISFRLVSLFLFANHISPALPLSSPALAQEYSICRSWREVREGNDFRYATPLRISDPGTPDRPAYTGYWFYDGLQFDATGRVRISHDRPFSKPRGDTIRPR
jgi:hypothetical protein